MIDIERLERQLNGVITVTPEGEAWLLGRNTRNDGVIRLADSGRGRASIANHFSNEVVSHASRGEFTYDPKTGKICKRKGGGYGQENLDLLDSLGM